eukprot:3478676-Lingulodinium_polyedra.AAC.1
MHVWGCDLEYPPTPPVGKCMPVGRATGAFGCAVGCGHVHAGVACNMYLVRLVRSTSALVAIIVYVHQPSSAVA